jgi:trypsin-like peptidase
MSRTVVQLLHDATVLITGPGVVGTGFFVSDDTLLTAAHVVGSKAALQVRHGDAVMDAQVIESVRGDSYPDLALLAVDGHDRTCAGLNDRWEEGDSIYTRGYATGTGYKGEPVHGTLAGESERPRALRIVDTELPPGMSGSPVLDMNTGGVCGIVVRQTAPAGGGRAVPISTVYATFPQLEAANLRALLRGREWIDALNGNQRHAGRWHRPLRLLGGAALRPELSELPRDAGFGEGTPKLVLPRDERALLVVTSGGARLLDVETGDVQWELDCPNSAAEVSPDGALLALAHGELVTVWDLHVGKCLHRFRMSGARADGSPEFDWRGVVWLLFGPDSDVLALSTTSPDGEPHIAVRRVAGARVDQLVPLSLEGGLGELSTIAPAHAMTPGSSAHPQQYLLATTIGLGVRRWRLSDGKALPKLKLATFGGIARELLASVIGDREPDVDPALFLYADREHLYVRGAVSLSTWNLGTGGRSGGNRVTGGIGEVAALRACHRDGVVLEGDANGRVGIRDFGSPAVELLGEAGGAVEDLRLSPDGAIGAAVHEGGIVSLWQVGPPSAVRTVPGSAIGHSAGRLTALSPGGDVLLELDSERWILRRSDDGAHVASATSTFGPLAGGHFVRGGAQLLLLGADAFTLVDAATGTGAPELPREDRTDVVVDDAGAIAVTVGADGMERCLDIGSGEVRWERSGADPALTLVISPGGERAAILRSTSLELRDCETGELLRRRELDPDESVRFHSAAFSADGRVLGATTRVYLAAAVAAISPAECGPCFALSAHDGSPLSEPSLGLMGQMRATAESMLREGAKQRRRDPRRMVVAEVAAFGSGSALVLVEPRSSVGVWNPLEDKAVDVLVEPERAMRRWGVPKFAIATDPERRRVAVTAPEAGVSLWDIERRERLLSADDVPFDAIALTPDGHTLVAAALDAGLVRCSSIRSAS